MTDITPAELDEWEKLCEAATEGPWELLDCAIQCMYVGKCPRRVIEGRFLKDQKFISASRTALPRLIAAYRELLAENVRLRVTSDDIEWGRQEAEKVISGIGREPDSTPESG